MQVSEFIKTLERDYDPTDEIIAAYWDVDTINSYMDSRLSDDVVKEIWAKVCATQPMIDCADTSGDLVSIAYDIEEEYLKELSPEEFTTSDKEGNDVR